MFCSLVEHAEDETVDNESRFIPPPLNLSVRVGHGGQDDEVVRELSKISDRAQKLEENQYYDQ